jgi:hypothetical protein
LALTTDPEDLTLAVGALCDGDCHGDRNLCFWLSVAVSEWALLFALALSLAALQGLEI